MAAVQQVTEEDEELLLISAGGQVVRTETNRSTATGSGARGVIVMRLNEGDKVVGIAAFRAGLAEQRAIGDNDDPRGRATRGRRSASRDRGADAGT